MSKKMVIGLRFLTWVSFVVYLVLLVNVIILKDGAALITAKHRIEISFSKRIDRVNFIPLKTIKPYLKGEPSIRIAAENLLGNIFAFSPFGFFLPILFKKCSRLKNIFLISFIVSFFIEAVQLEFYLGSSDIDDLILNVLGSLLGFGVYCLLKNIYKRKFIFAS